MIIINFSHPFTPEQKQQIEDWVAGNVQFEYIQVPSQFNQTQSFPEQISHLVDSIGLSSEDWQSLPILVNPPAYNFAALTLLAELHGRMGYFPSIIRVRPVEDSTPLRYEVAEIINLQEVRDFARLKRS
jgi:hypothetical protein